MKITMTSPRSTTYQIRQSLVNMATMVTHPARKLAANSTMVLLAGLRRITPIIIKRFIELAPLESSTQFLIDTFPARIAGLLKLLLKPPTDLNEIFPKRIATQIKKVYEYPFEDEGYDSIKHIKEVKIVSIESETKLPPMKAYQYTPSHNSGKYLVYVNANAQNAADNFLLGGELKRLADNYHMICTSMDYRGKGENKIDGKSWLNFSTLDDVRDQQNLINHLIQSGVNPSDLTVMGLSLGSQVAIWAVFDLIVQRLVLKLMIERLTISLEQKEETPLTEILRAKTTESEIIKILNQFAKASEEFAEMLAFYQSCNTAFSDSLVSYINSLLQLPETCRDLLNRVESESKNSDQRLKTTLQDYFNAQPAYEKINLISWSGFAQLTHYSQVFENQLDGLFDYYKIKKHIKLNFFSLSLIFKEMNMIPKHFRIDDAAAFVPRCRMFRVKKDDIIPGDGPPEIKEPSLVKTVLQRYPRLEAEGRAIALECNWNDPHNASPNFQYFSESAKMLNGDSLIASIVLQQPIRINLMNGPADDEIRKFINAHNQHVDRYRHINQNSAEISQSRLKFTSC